MGPCAASERLFYSPTQLFVRSFLRSFMHCPFILRPKTIKKERERRKKEKEFGQRERVDLQRDSTDLIASLTVLSSVSWFLTTG